MVLKGLKLKLKLELELELELELDLELELVKRSEDVLNLSKLLEWAVISKLGTAGTLEIELYLDTVLFTCVFIARGSKIIVPLPIVIKKNMDTAGEIICLAWICLSNG